MANIVTFSSTALDEGTSEAAVAAVKLFLRDEDDSGNPLTGNDRYYIAVDVQVDGDDGSKKRVTVVRQATSIPVGIVSGADKLEFLRIAKLFYNAGRSVATND